MGFMFTVIFQNGIEALTGGLDQSGNSDNMKITEITVVGRAGSFLLALIFRIMKYPGF